MIFNWKARWPFFEPHELLSQMGNSLFVATGRLMMQEQFLDSLHAFRKEVAVPILINHSGLYLRGYRHQQEHDSIDGGAKFSPHVQGIAVDFTPVGMTLEEAFVAAKDFGFSGVGYYPERNFVHIDTAFRSGGQAIWKK